MKRVRLGVNIDHVATVRQTRRGRTPDPLQAARAALRGGADHLVCHLREDRRHIQDADVRALARRFPGRLNLEMSVAPDIVRVALAVRPWRVTLVPERRQELTTEGGLDVVRLGRRLAVLLPRFERVGIEVSLFVDPREEQLAAGAQAGARIVELHTGDYAEARTRRARANALRRLARAARRAKTLGCAVAAGHGLDYGNVQAVAAIPEVEELNIGFSIVSRALVVGLQPAVAEMIRRIQR